MKNRQLFLVLLLATITFLNGYASERRKYNFNSQWLLHVGDLQNAQQTNYDDAKWEKITLPRAFNEDEAFKVDIKDMTTGISWYRKHFKLPQTAKGKKVFVEFEGVRQGAEFYLNGKYIGIHENGVMAFGFDLTPYLNFDGDNVIAARIDNEWKYKEKETGSRYQWSDINFNVNYGGIPKNVWLHITDKLYQTLPLYSNLKTTGVYIYASEIDVNKRKAIINAESEVRNEHDKAFNVNYEVSVYDYDGKLMKTFKGQPVSVKPNKTVVVKASSELSNLKFWSWGYGYLYDVKTRLLIDNKVVDEVVTRTGFRKTKFEEGKVWLNDRVIQLKGYAQRTSNEWPGVGMSVPPWMSDYSNGMMIDHNANFFRWMHVAPWKQDVESCDRTGVIQVMPAGDAEKDPVGRWWSQRTELMRDAIIYFRNNPSILFYECGNNNISEPHMEEMKAIRDKYDPHGGRAIGSRNMLDSKIAEWGGEMLYINKSAKHPMFATEYCRDEGLRKYWDDYSYPFHKEGAGPLYRNADASAYNHNQDMFAVELIRRWHDYWRERPGTGRRTSAGGAKIIFSDTQTHSRGEENYRRSGVVDPLRIPKDGYFAHKVMWDGWVDIENQSTYIIGHWNYTPDVIKPVYVVSSGEKVELFVNGKSKGFGKQDYRFLFTFDDIQWEKGTIEAVSYNEKDKELSRYSIKTTGDAKRLKMTAMHSPKGFFADGADITLVQVEVVDENGNRCPLANDMIKFNLQGPAEWRGGMAQGPDNYVLAKELPVECGITRVMIRSTDKAGKITLKAETAGLESDEITLISKSIEVKDGLSDFFPSEQLPSRFDKGETPKSPSYTDTKRDIRIVSANVAVNSQDVKNSYDDNELSDWSNDGNLNTAWITYNLEKEAVIDEVCLKLGGFRRNSFPLEILAGEEVVWSGNTDMSLGYIHLDVKPIKTKQISIRLKGATVEKDAFSQITEVAAKSASESESKKSKGKHHLRIIEGELKESVNR